MIFQYRFLLIQMPNQIYSRRFTARILMHVV